MPAARPDTPVCVCGHVYSGHNYQRRGMFRGYGACKRTVGHAGSRVNTNLCPCMRFREVKGSK